MKISFESIIYYPLYIVKIVRRIINDYIYGFIKGYRNESI